MNSYQPRQKLAIAPIATLLAALALKQVNAAGVVLDHDVTIDAASPISGNFIQVVDGVDGAAHVNINSGGTVSGFYGSDNSEIILNGGSVTVASSLHGNSKFAMKSGQMACTDPICQVSDYIAFIVARDFSTLHFYGGSFSGTLRLLDSSTAHFYGQNFSLSVSGGMAYVEGTYLNGASFLVGCYSPPDIASHIVFHNIPEPRSAKGLLGIACFLLCRGRSRVVLRRPRTLSRIHCLQSRAFD